MQSNPLNDHISSQFDASLENARSMFLKMGGVVEKQIAEAIQSLTDNDIPLAQQVYAKDDLVNQMEQELDDQLTRILVRQQPTAKDLRLIMSISKSNTDLERIGDEATKIAWMVQEIIQGGEPPIGITEVRHMSNQVRLMIHEALDAFARCDVDKAFNVMQNDTVIDEEYQVAMRSLVTYVMQDNSYVSQMLNVIWILRAIERIGDHARNIAEQVIYSASGTDVRHTNFDEVEKAISKVTKDN